MKTFTSLEDALQAPGAEALRLNCQELDRIPDEIAALDALRSLRLDQVHSDLEFPDVLGDLPTLDTLSIEGPKDCSVPFPKVFFDAGLSELGFKNFRVSEVVPMAEQLTRLRLASHFIFEDIDTVCEHFTELEYLEVWGHFARNLDGRVCQLAFPAAIENLINLEELEVVSAGLAELPDEVGRLERLETIRLRNNAFERFPVALTEVPNLRDLEFSQMKQVTEYPDELTKMVSLRRLDLEGSWNHGDLPSSWEDYAYHELPEVIGRLSGLEALNVSQCALPSLAPLESLTGLRELSVQWGAFEDLTPLKALQALEVLSFENGWIRDISALAELGSLRVLDIAHTNVEDLAPLASLSNLEVLDMRSTPADDEPAEALEPLLGLPKLAEVLSHELNAEQWSTLSSGPR